MPQQYHLAFWNVENLFDIEGSPRRTEKLTRTLGDAIVGWTQQLLDRKISQLASVIRRMNNGRGPDLLGVCEVENRFVLELLVQALAPLGRNYGIVHHDTEDQRGIDVAFLYDQALFQPQNVFSHFIMKRTATRDIVQVNFQTSRGRLFVVVGNHWPSRLGDESESEAYRAMAGETLAYFHERILQVHGSETPVLAMGDFNDEPFNESIVNYALAERTKSKVLRGRIPYFLNLMWPLLGQGLLTHYYDGPNVLDQFLANKNLLRADSPLKILPESVNIFKPSNSATPVRFGGMGKPVNQNGFSDHFPIEVFVSEAD